MKSFQVARANLSPYQSENFGLQEKNAIEAFPGLRYLPLKDLDPEAETILITNTHTQFKNLDPQILKKTKLILHPNSGYDHWLEEKNFWKDIPVVVGHTIRAQAVAEYTLGCLFDSSLQLPQHLSWDTNRKWDRRLLKDSEIWVFGYGHIGKIVADTLKTLGAQVVVVDPYIESCPHPHFKNWKDGQIKNAQAIAFCCSLNSSTEHFVNEDFLYALSGEVVLVNGARGKLIDGNALREYLKFHPKAFAYLDVFEQEPFRDEWQNVPQVWKTSHIAGVSKDLDQGIIDFETRVLKDFLSLGPQGFSEKYARELLQNKWKNGVLV